MYRIIYKSRSVTPLNWDIVRSITSTSERNNEALGVTGVLMASRTHFMQVLEEWQALAMINDIKMMRDLPEWKK